MVFFIDKSGGLFLGFLQIRIQKDKLP